MEVALLSFARGPADGYYATALANGLVNHRDVRDVSLVFPENSSFPDSLEERVKLLEYPFPESAWKSMLNSLDPRFCLRIGKIIDSIDPDIVHVVFEIRAAPLVVRYLRSDYPVIATIHEPEAHWPRGLRSSVINPIHNFNTKILTSVVDSIIVHGTDSKRKLLAKNVSEPDITIIPHIDISQFMYKHATRRDSTSEKNVLFFGQIQPRKGIEYFIEAGKQILADVPDTTIMIAGTGDIGRYESRVRSDERFDFRNRFIPETEVAELFQRASVLVLPYVVGSQSGLVTIAARFETPVVATDVGNFSEQVIDGETGFVVEPKNEDALADAVRRLLQDEGLRKEMGENAYAHCNEEFSWSAIAEQHRSLYEEVCGDYIP